MPAAWEIIEAARVQAERGLPADQDPVLNHAAGVKVTATTASATLITPPAGTKYVRVMAEADVLLRTDGQAAADDGGSIRLVANSPEVIPVYEGVPVTVRSVSGTAVVRSTPMKAR